MPRTKLAALIFLTLTNFAHGELKEGEYILLQPSQQMQTTNIVEVQRIEVVSKGGRKYLIVRYEGDSNGLEPFQIEAELIENEEKKSFYAIAPPHKFTVEGKIYEREVPNVFVGRTSVSGVISCSWSRDNGDNPPSFEQYRLYPLKLTK